MHQMHNPLGTLVDYLSYYDIPTGSKYHATMEFANLVPEEGVSALPTSKGQAFFAPINDPVLFKLPVRHPLQIRYPNLRVEYKALIIDPDYMVGRNGASGVSLYVSYNQTTGVFAEVTSENGRCGVAPWDWEGEPETLTDPAAQPYLQVRKFNINGQEYYWQNWFHHGHARLTGCDWRDGVPTSLETMYIKGQGRVRQSILLPKESPIGSLAEQTMHPEEVTDFYSIVLFTPRSEFLELTNKVYPSAPQYTRSPFESAIHPKKGGDFTLGSPSRSFRGVLESLGADEEEYEEKGSGIRAELKMGAGGTIKQHIRIDPFGPWIYNPQPAIAFVLVPVFKAQAEQLFGVQVPKKRSVF